MEKRALGRSGLEVSICCLGTMTWGRQNSPEEAFSQMDYAVSRGVNFFDAAEIYPVPPDPSTHGRTEDIIGDWFKARGGRDKILVATKVCGRSQNLTWLRPKELLNENMVRLTQAQIDHAVEGSLKRLGGDAIDLYQIHWPDRAYEGFGYFSYQDYPDDYAAFSETLAALARHIEKGNVRHLGLSNESPWGVMRFLAAAETQGLPRVHSIQNAYNLVNRTFEAGLAEIAMRELVGLLAYSPLGQGYLTGKYRGGALPQGSRKALFQRLQRYEHAHADAAITSYLNLALAHSWDPGQMALAFCASRPFMTSVIIGATNLDQLKTNLDAFDLSLDRALIADINALHMARSNPCP